MKIFPEDEKKESKIWKKCTFIFLKFRILNIKGARKTLLFILNCISYIFTNYIQSLI